jgi:hypothetical protein
MILYEQLSYTEYSEMLDHIGEKDLKKWRKGTYFDWAEESRSLLPLVYDFKSPLGYAYQFRCKDVFNQRLQKAAVRLAWILDGIFQNRELSPEEKQLRKKISL